MLDLMPILTSALQDPIAILLVSLVFVVCSIVFFRIGAFLSLLLGASMVSFWSFALNGEGEWSEAVVRVGSALGTTTGKICVLIVFGTIIGKCMTDSGAADRIILACLRLFGEKRASVALSAGAFLLSIPVFYDATFYLLLPLAKSVYRNVRKRYALYLLAVGLGATISHTMIPPTPGPIAVAQTLGVSISTALGIGLLVGAFLLPLALVLAHYLDRSLPNPTIDEAILKEIGLDRAGQERTTEIAKLMEDDPTLPSLRASLTPIVLPAILIALASIVKTIVDPTSANASSLFLQTLFLLGEPNVALFLASLCACGTLLFSKKRRTTRFQLEEKLNAAISSASSIVLITAAGGAYGAMLRESGIGERIQSVFNATGDLSGSTALIVAFLATALLKSAQGSSTTSMITSASIFASMGFTSASLGFNLGYLAAAIGAGSSVASWMNDSGFCLFSRSSGISEVDCLKIWTVGTGALGFCGLFVILILCHIFPMI